MTNVKLLNSLIEESGMTKVFSADKMGVSRPRLYKILEGAECTVSEMMSLSNVLRLTNKQRSDVFLCK